MLSARLLLLSMLLFLVALPFGMLGASQSPGLGRDLTVLGFLGAFLASLASLVAGVMAIV